MALRDVAGVLNGLRKVAAALYAETTSELQHSLSGSRSGLGPAACSLYRSTSQGLTEYGELKWAGKWSGGAGRDFFPEWEELEDQRLFPTTDNSSSSLQHDVEVPKIPSSLGSKVNKLGEESPFPPRPPPPQPPAGNSRGYHTLAPTNSHSPHHPVYGGGSRRQWFHSGTRYGNETVVGGGSRSEGTADSTAKKKPSKPNKQKLSSRARERAVPVTRVSRLFSFGGLVAGLGVGAAAEVVKRSLGMANSPSPVADNPLLTEANVERIVNTLCTVRGAALKIGQMISLQDSNLVPEPIQDMFDRVRNSADFMPLWQMEKVLKEELGEGWREKVAEFDPQPLAAASIGQVHSVVLHSGQPAAMKIQYPGVAQSIDSDIDNLVGILKLWNILPEGLFVDELVVVARKELAWETDYTREAKCQNIFRELLAGDPGYLVPEVFPELSTKRVLTTELIQGLPLDQCASLPQETRNDIAARVLDLVMRELFEFRFMQTDPNWSNFFYNPDDNRICLLDFGASREYPKMFTDHYLKVIHGSIMEDRDRVLESSKAMGFLTGYESKTLLDAHYQASLILGEPFKHDTPFDFGHQDTTAKIHRLFPVILGHRLTPPPEESYSLHRKLSGAFLLCTRLQATFNCHSIYQRIYQHHTFSD